MEIWKDKWFLDSLRNTFVYSFTTVPITIAGALVLAVVHRQEGRGQEFRSGSCCSSRTYPMSSPWSIVWVMMYAPFGPLTRLVKLFGIANPPQWLADYSWAMPAVILMTIWGGLGYAVLIYSAAIQTLPKDLYEAADIDGAGPVRTFVKVTVPLLSPTTFFPGRHLLHHVVPGLRADPGHDQGRSGGPPRTSSSTTSSRRLSHSTAWATRPRSPGCSSSSCSRSP